MEVYRAGIHFIEPVRQEQQPSVRDEEPVEDYYDILQLSPKADLDTIHRVYRILAQRFHPDNVETGSDKLFRRVLEAYRVLSDPEKRAAYDAGHGKLLKAKWRLLESLSDGSTMEGEKAKRQGILLLLYSRRVNNPTHPGLGTHELEDLLGIPREHLEFSIWFLKEAGFVTRGDNGRVAITYKGVEAAELEPMKAPAHRMITAGDEKEKPAA
jgi:curved DNA-binding protein CbpA